jgi:hypothetical protein
MNDESSTNTKQIALVAIVVVAILAVAALVWRGRDRGATPEATSAPTEVAATAEPATREPAAEAATAQEATEPEQETSPLNAPESPLTAPESPLTAPIVVEPPALEAETTADSGGVTGRLMVLSGGERPVVNMIVGLAEVIRDDDGVPRVAGYDAANAFRTTTDDFGRFAINEVAPGTYAIIVDAVITSIMLADPVTGDPILVDVEPDSVVNIGRLDYDSLALPGYVE